MADSFAWRRLGEALRLRVEITAAIAREHVLQTHVRNALDLIETARGRIPVLRAFDIYARLLRLSDHETQVLRNRVLASDIGWALLDGPAETDIEQQASAFQRMRRRLRGRVDPDLRHAVELAVGAAETGLFDCHIENAVQLVHVLERTAPVGEAVQLYCDLLGVRSGQVELIYYQTLSRLRQARLHELLDAEAATRAEAEAEAAGATDEVEVPAGALELDAADQGDQPDGSTRAKRRRPASGSGKAGPLVPAAVPARAGEAITATGG